jgi:flagellar biosynthesis protein FliR
MTNPVAAIPVTAVMAFLLVLARVSGAASFVPLPGSAAAPVRSRVILALGFTVALYPVWPSVAGAPTPGQLVCWLLAEASFGCAVGLVVGFLTESFVIFGQLVGLQAGYSYASTIDPNTQADNGIVIVLAQTFAGLLFFALGLHREVFRIFARSLETLPPGSFNATPGIAEGIIRLSSSLFSTGFRMALPVVALLVMVDLALALLGRINSQLQLISLAFPIKMLTALALFAAVAGLFPHVYRGYADRLLEALPRLANVRP